MQVILDIQELEPSTTENRDVDEEEKKQPLHKDALQKIMIIHKKKVSVHKRDISVDDIDPKQFTTTQTNLNFGDTIGGFQNFLSTQQRIILDLPTTLADLFEYFSHIE